jgi:predicted ATPase
MLPRLDSRLSLLTAGPRDVPTRQQTLRGALDWSYDLLPDVAKTLFARLAVFVGGFDLPAAEAVCDADLDTLQLLVDNSLVRPVGERFSLLEAVREYASERLAADREADTVRLRHAHYFAEIGERSVGSVQRGDDDGPMERWLIANAENLEGANALLKAAGLREGELRSVEPLAVAQIDSGRKEEALRTLHEYLEAPDLQESRRCKLEALAAWIAADCGHHERARRARRHRGRPDTPRSRSSDRDLGAQRSRSGCERDGRPVAGR